MSHIPGFRFFENHREYGAVFVRLVVAFVLVYGTQDNVLSHERMLEFRDFLAARRVPLPLFAAHLSVYAQFLCGILFALGLLVRPAALLMVINFVAALVIAHLDAPLDAAGSRSACSSRRSSCSLTGRARSRSTGISKGAGRV